MACLDEWPNLRAERTVVIKAPLFDIVVPHLKSTGFVVPQASGIPFPCCGQQRNFHARMRDIDLPPLA